MQAPPQSIAGRACENKLKKNRAANNRVARLVISAAVDVSGGLVRPVRAEPRQPHLPAGAAPPVRVSTREAEVPGHAR